MRLGPFVGTGVAMAIWFRPNRTITINSLINVNLYSFVGFKFFIFSLKSAVCLLHVWVMEKVKLMPISK